MNRLMNLLQKRFRVKREPVKKEDMYWEKVKNCEGEEDYSYALHQYNAVKEMIRDIEARTFNNVEIPDFKDTKKDWAFLSYMVYDYKTRDWRWSKKYLQFGTFPTMLMQLFQKSKADHELRDYVLISNGNKNGRKSGAYVNMKSTSGSNIVMNDKQLKLILNSVKLLGLE